MGATGHGREEGGPDAPPDWGPSEYHEARIGSLDHWSTATRAEYLTLTATTLCGQRLAGTPSAPTSSGFCEPCQGLLPCDECGHPGTEHLWAPALGGQAELFVYEHATCWAENVCRACDPALHARVLAMLPPAPARLGPGEGLEAPWEHGLW